LLKNMLKASGTVMKADFGPRPLSEGDLLLRVKDEGINNAICSQCSYHRLCCSGGSLPRPL
jgi:hypothetical protein